MADHFCLKWNNFQTSILTAFESLHNSEDLVDVTLMCEGRNVKAHKVILSACSPYFRNLFKEHPCQHPVIILKDVYYCDLQAILQFMYQGEVLITQDQLSSFLKTAELLQVSGLAGAMPPSVSEQPIVPEPIAASTAADTMKSELTFTKHTPEVTRKDADKKTYESKAEPLQSCSYTSSDNVLIKMESDNDDFELVDTDYGSSNHENMDESSTLGEEESILERSLKAQSGMSPHSTKLYTMDLSIAPQICAKTSPNSSSHTLVEHKKADVPPLIFYSNNALVQKDVKQKIRMSYDMLLTSKKKVFLSKEPGRQTKDGKCEQKAELSHGSQCGKCPHCFKVYSNQSALKYHVRLVHSDMLNMFCCHICPESFEFRESYKVHMWEAHNVRN